MVRLTEDEMDEKLLKYRNGLTDLQKEKFDEFTSQLNIRQYAKKSNKNFTKMAKTMRKNILKAYPEIGDSSGFEKPKGKKGEEKKFIKPKSKKGKPRKSSKTVTGQYVKHFKSKVPKKVKRKISVERRKQTLKAPSGRSYSATELREGVNSKRSKEWRKKNKIPVNDFEYIKK